MSQHNAITVEASRSKPHDSNNPSIALSCLPGTVPSSLKPHGILSALLIPAGGIAAVEDRQSTPPIAHATNITNAPTQQSGRAATEHCPQPPGPIRINQPELQPA
ncbi:hypothetical protein [Bifidobacterium boum]|uniref:hypothetical protein n=1 Tax=Bifidobacterium boum TaxID=78343 RepID=UPI003F8ED94D